MNTKVGSERVIKNRIKAA